jgi:hypothetical protein
VGEKIRQNRSPIHLCLRRLSRGDKIDLRKTTRDPHAIEIDRLFFVKPL